MPTIHAILTLLDDTILSAHSKTVEVAQSLTYIPGRVLLGAVASRLYSSLQPDEQFSVFHASGVRFMDARPVIVKDGKIAPTYAVPLSYHHEKGTKQSKTVHKVSYLTNSVENFVQGRRPKVQYKQVRDLFMTEAMETISISKNGSLRTSLKEGQAREGYLFGFDAIRKDTQFLATIEVQSEDVCTQIKGVLKEGIRVGRSKTAEFGRVQVKFIEDNFCLSKEEHTLSNEVPFYFASDVSLRNSFGQPTLDLNVFATRMGASSWVADKTFVRSRQYSPFHGVRFRPDLERQVWTMGSVVTLQFDKKVSLEQLEQSLKNGLGEYTNEGLGEVLVAPSFLTITRVKEASNQSSKKQEALEIPESLRWLKTHQAQHNYDLAVDALVDDWVQNFQNRFPDHARYISKTQWGNVLEIARIYSDDKELAERLVGTAMGEHGGGYVFLGKRKLRTSWGYKENEATNQSIAALLFTCVNSHLEARSSAIPKDRSPVRMKDVVCLFAKKMRGGKRS